MSGLTLLTSLEKPRASRAPSFSALNSTRPAASWEDYVQVLLMESGQVARAAIHRISNGRPVAATEDFVLNGDQVDAVLHGFEDSTALRRDGISLAQYHYTLTRLTDTRIMVGRDVTSGAGCIIYKCKTCLLLACYEEGNHPGGCYTLVTRLGDFLMESGF